MKGILTRCLAASTSHLAWAEWAYGLETIMTTTYRVSGMTCEGCAKSIVGAIKKAAPEAKVDVDLDAKTVTVDGFDDSAAIGKAVTDAGFEFAGAV